MLTTTQIDKLLRDLAKMTDGRKATFTAKELADALGAK